MTFVTRAQWGAAPPKATTAWAAGQPTSVTVHAVGSTVGLHEDYRADVLGIQAHAFAKQLSDIDYNFLVDAQGDVYEGRGSRVQSGAQHVGNDESLAICYLDFGDGDVPFTDAAKLAIVDLRDKHVPRGRFLPHRFWNQFDTTGEFATTCPGDEISAWCDAGGPRPNAKPIPRRKPMFLVKDPRTDPAHKGFVYITDGLTKRKLGSDDETAKYQARLAAAGLPNDIDVHFKATMIDAIPDAR
jgi:hypothetical protein